MELERIKAERAAAAEKKAAEAAALEDKEREENAMKGNPLMNTREEASIGSSKIKRAWNDDVVFRNQTRGEPETKKRFINDAVRSDFHRQFLKRFMTSTDR